MLVLLPGDSTSCTVPEEDVDSGDGGASVRPFAMSSLYLRDESDSACSSQGSVAAQAIAKSMGGSTRATQAPYF